MSKKSITYIENNPFYINEIAEKIILEISDKESLKNFAQTNKINHLCVNNLIKNINNKLNEFSEIKIIPNSIVTKIAINFFNKNLNKTLSTLDTIPLGLINKFFLEIIKSEEVLRVIYLLNNENKDLIDKLINERMIDFHNRKPLSNNAIDSIAIKKYLDDKNFNYKTLNYSCIPNVIRLGSFFKFEDDKQRALNLVNYFNIYELYRLIKFIELTDEEKKYFITCFILKYSPHPSLSEHFYQLGGQLLLKELLESPDESKENLQRIKKVLKRNIIINIEHLNLSREKVTKVIYDENSPQNKYLEMKILKNTAKSNLIIHINRLNNKLFNAIKNKDINEVKDCIRKGAQPNAQYLGKKFGIASEPLFSTLHLAAINNDIEIMKLLLSYSTLNLKFRNSHGHLPIHYALHNNSQEMIDLIMKACPELIFEFKNLIHDAAAHGNIKLINKIIEKTAYSINLPHPDTKLLPVIYAAKINQVETIKWLLENGADINAKDEFGNSLLHLAVKNKNYDLCVYLIDKGINVNAKNNQGETALHLAATQYEIAELLIKHGKINVKQKNNFNNDFRKYILKQDKQKFKTLLKNSKS